MFLSFLLQRTYAFTHRRDCFILRIWKPQSLCTGVFFFGFLLCQTCKEDDAEIKYSIDNHGKQHTTPNEIPAFRFYTQYIHHPFDTNYTGTFAAENKGHCVIMYQPDSPGQIENIHRIDCRAQFRISQLSEPLFALRRYLYHENCPCAPSVYHSQMIG